MSLQNKKRFILVALVLALVLAIGFELIVFAREPILELSGNASSVLDPDVCMMQVSRYDTGENGEFKPNAPDPQLMFLNISQNVNYLCISFKENLKEAARCQVFFAKNNDFSEANSIVMDILQDQKSVIIELPNGEFDDLRLDIDGAFTLEDIVVSDNCIVVKKVLANPLNAYRIVTTFAVVSLIAVLLLRWICSENPRKLAWYELLFLCLVFVYYVAWAVAKDYNYGPDEGMRYDVTWFLYVHNRLPVRDELLSHWGFSYAHLPTLACNLFGYCLMKFTTIYTKDAHSLLIAARMVSVFCCTGVVYFVIKLSRVLFKTPIHWLMISIIAFIPEFAFLSSYVNNDSIALLGVSIILYAWVLGMTDNWNLERCILLSVGIAFCAISYYNSYGWILLSIFFFIFSYLYKNRKDYKGLWRNVCIIVEVVLVLSAYCFVRHLVIYGDLIGFKTNQHYRALYAIPELKAENCPSIMKQGISLKTMFFDMHWLRITFRSFVGNFGYMLYECPIWVYQLAMLVVCVALFGGVVGIVTKTVKRETISGIQVAFYVSCILSAVITVGLSVYNSYTGDFQPQGRYCYPAIYTFAMFITMGCNELLKLVKPNKYKCILVALVCIVMTGVSLYVFNEVYLPS